MSTRRIHGVDNIHCFKCRYEKERTLKAASGSRHNFCDGFDRSDRHFCRDNGGRGRVNRSGRVIGNVASQTRGDNSDGG